MSHTELLALIDGELATLRGMKVSGASLARVARVYAGYEAALLGYREIAERHQPRASFSNTPDFCHVCYGSEERRPCLTYAAVLSWAEKVKANG